jgi:hypothetical protein
LAKVKRRSQKKKDSFASLICNAESRAFLIGIGRVSVKIFILEAVWKG